MKVLQQRKMYEGQRDQLQSSSWSMEQAAMTTENLRNVMTTVDAMKSANKEMRKQYGKVDINKIERLQGMSLLSLYGVFEDARLMRL